MARICAPAAPAGSFAAEVVARLPDLRAQALGMTRNRVAAEDLVQDAVCRALANADRFDGADIDAWLATILRNRFIQNRRASSNRRLHISLTPFDAPKRFDSLSSDSTDPTNFIGTVAASQMDHMMLSDTVRLLGKLPRSTQACLIEVALTDQSMEHMAAKHGCPTGTMKSRIARARAAFAAMIGGRQELAA